MTRVRVVLVEGRGLALPGHWTRRWARANPWYEVVPRRPVPEFDIDERVTALEATLAADPTGPVVLVAHSAGCLTVVEWAARSGGGGVRGALLSAPPYIEPDWEPEPESGITRRIVVPLKPLPFPAIVVASRTDPYASFEESTTYAGAWGARLVDAGDAGHLDTRSGFGPFPLGEQLLADLLGPTPGPTPAAIKD